ncbi:hypothetical protein [Tenacibaculum amylolyticum]|uniref:hypothetical protein n=1 Tax=Tenacibaculum amylolyticum TaxID=104269 RepID=UPI00389637B7
MKIIQKASLLLLFVFALISCDSSSNDQEIVGEQSGDIQLSSSDFDIEVIGDKFQYNQQTLNVKNLTNQVAITNVKWYINGIINDSSSQSSLDVKFDDYGTNEILAILSLSNSQIIEIRKEINITEKPHSKATIIGVAITGISGHILSDFQYHSNGGSTLISLQSKFVISNIHDGTIYEISDENFINNRTRDFENIIWEKTDGFYTLKIFEDGNSDDTVKITFYGQNIELGRPEARIASDIISLNDYRIVKPRTIDFTSQGITYKLAVIWE